MGRHASTPVRSDKASMTLQFTDGSIATINYLANGDKGFPKERVEVFAAGRVLQLDNFRKLKGWGWRNSPKMSLWKQDKGQQACASAFFGAVTSGAETPIPLDEIVESSRVAIEAALSLD